MTTILTIILSTYLGTEWGKWERRHEDEAAEHVRQATDEIDHMVERNDRFYKERMK